MTLRDSTGVDAPMVAAEGTLFPSARRLTAQTDDTEPVVVLEVRLQVGQPDLTMPMPERAADVTATVLATAPISVDEWPGKTVAAGHVTVDPGATLNFPAVPGPVLLILESGELELTASAEWVAGPGSWIESAGDNRSSTDGVVAPPNQVRVAFGPPKCPRLATGDRCPFAPVTRVSASVPLVPPKLGG